MRGKRGRSVRKITRGQMERSVHKKIIRGKMSLRPQRNMKGKKRRSPRRNMKGNKGCSADIKIRAKRRRNTY
jgi:hypothetical protein